MDPVPDSIAFLVRGHAREPDHAVELANSAARHFVRELNRAGPGVGSFSVQDLARTPLEPIVWPSSETAIAASGVAGMLAAVVLAAFLTWVRRPLLTAGDAVAALGVPLLGTVAVCRQGRRPRSARVVCSHPLVLDALARRLRATSHGGFVLLGAARSRRVRRAVAGPLHHALIERNGAGTPELAMAAGGPPADPDRLSGELERRGRRVVLMEDWAAPTEHQATDRGSSSWGVVVVVERGTPARTLSLALDEWPSDALAGVIVLRTLRRRRGRST
jgi:hypothetical protein